MVNVYPIWGIAVVVALILVGTSLRGLTTGVHVVGPTQSGQAEALYRQALGASAGQRPTDRRGRGAPAGGLQRLRRCPAAVSASDRLAGPRRCLGALTGLGQAHRARGDYQAARDVLEEAIATGHPDWAPQAMIMLEYLLRGYDEAQVMFHAAISTGHPGSGPEAMFLLAHLLHRTGDDDGAKAACQLLAGSASPASRSRALCQLADLLQRQGDSDGAKAA